MTTDNTVQQEWFPSNEERELFDTKTTEHIRQVKMAASDLNLGNLRPSAEAGHRSGYWKGYRDAYEEFKIKADWQKQQLPVAEGAGEKQQHKELVDFINGITDTIPLGCLFDIGTDEERKMVLDAGLKAAVVALLFTYEACGLKNYITSTLQQPSTGDYFDLSFKRVTDASPHQSAEPVTQHNDLIQAFKEVLRISDRKHDAWDKAKDLIAKYESGNPPVTQERTFKANFLFGFDDDSIEALGFELANGLTEEYLKEVWDTLVEKIKSQSGYTLQQVASDAWDASEKRHDIIGWRGEPITKEEYLASLPVGDDWVSVEDEKPTDADGRVLCWVKEVNDLGISGYFWSCSYSKLHGFTDQFRRYNVISWKRVIAPLPKPPKK